VRVLGGAGTGKTVLAMHRAAWLARQHVASGQKVLFTTFTKNLAFDIEQNLKSLMAGDPALERIEVRNLDRWVHAYLHRKKYPHSIVYGLQHELWKTALPLAPGALGLDDAFYEDEWSQVITAQGVQTLDDYRRATRTGRRTVLTRAKRDQIWPVFEEYRLQLSSQRRKDADDAFGDAAVLLASDPEKPYATIVVDETQDFGPQALKLLRAMVASGPNDLFFVGDGHQRIYSRHRASMAKCGINIQGRSKKLYLNYRTTEEIRRTAVALLEGREIDDLDGGTDDNSRYKSLSHGPAPEVVDMPSADAGIKLAVERVTEWVKEPEIAAGTICVMAPTKKMRDAVGEQLESAGIAVTAIEVEAPDTASTDAVRVATMHRAKGLEFDRVVVLAPNGIEPVGGTDIEQLIYVSLTRAKTGAVLVR
jgi:superfamily I DNA/RNA helicase